MLVLAGGGWVVEMLGSDGHFEISDSPLLNINIVTILQITNEENKTQAQ